MKNEKEAERWLVFRIVIPAFPGTNVFSRIAKKITALGPIMVAAVANKLWGWRVEVIDENNYHRGPKDSQGLPDHGVLQQENPADAVGFFCGLSSTMERVWQLAAFYRSKGAATIAGGWHAHYQPEESLKKDIEIVVHGEGENFIQLLLRAIEKKRTLKDIPGISFLDNGAIKTNPAEEKPNLNNLPLPDFGLLKFAKLKFYPIGRTRGCGKNCEFCSVRGKPHWACAQHLFATVQWLVETRKARNFFIVDDRLEEDREGTVEFFKLIAKKYGCFLKFTAQLRLETAKDNELLEVMKRAGVKVVCIGYESCLDEELELMRKGYSSANMVEWTKIFHKFGFFIHGMFIFGYPPTDERQSNISDISAQERMARLKKFIRRCRLDTVQILRPVPLPGTALRSRLEKDGKLFSLDKVPWKFYDGSYACFQPKNMTLTELQELPTQIMRWFYSPFGCLKIPIKTLVFPFDYLIRGWQQWYRGWRNGIVRYGGHFLVKRWRKYYQDQTFLKKLE